jgi:RNA recognition motif-containing protein
VQVGFVVSADVVKGPDGRSRGFGFVTLKDQESAENAISSLNDTELNGRNISVRESTPRARD